MPADSSASDAAAGWRQVADSLLGLVQTRIELFAVEFREERARGLALFLHLTTALFLGMRTVLVLTARGVAGFFQLARPPAPAAYSGLRGHGPRI
jgi:uncharacterized membrane protein YqjE